MKQELRNVCCLLLAFSHSSCVDRKLFEVTSSEIRFCASKMSRKFYVIVQTFVKSSSSSKRKRTNKEKKKSEISKCD